MASHLRIDRILGLLGPCAADIGNQCKHEKARPTKEPTGETNLAHDEGARSIDQLDLWRRDLREARCLRLERRARVKWSNSSVR
jgi:hypothetical protein